VHATALQLENKRTWLPVLRHQGGRKKEGKKGHYHTGSGLQKRVTMTQIIEKRQDVDSRFSEQWLRLPFWGQNSKKNLKLTVIVNELTLADTGYYRLYCLFFDTGHSACDLYVVDSPQTF
jgi:hypothetical protein